MRRYAVGVRRRSGSVIGLRDCVHRHRRDVAAARCRPGRERRVADGGRGARVRRRRPRYRARANRTVGRAARILRPDSSPGRPRISKAPPSEHDKMPAGVAMTELVPAAEPRERDRGRRPEAALCLSGGGYRAMLFHVGALWRLNEAGYLPRLDRISSVSGGSITAGVLGATWDARASTRGVARRLRGRARGRRSARWPGRRSTTGRSLGGLFAARLTIGDQRRGRLPEAPLRRRDAAGPAPTGRASSSTRPTCSRAPSGGSPSRTCATTGSARCKTPTGPSGRRRWPRRRPSRRCSRPST